MLQVVDPLPQTVCRGVVRIEVRAPTATSVRFLVDGQLRGRCPKRPFVFDWYTARFPEGAHTITVEALGPNGTETTSLALTVSNAVSDQTVIQPFPAGSLWRHPIPLSAKLDPGNAAKMAYWRANVVPHYPNVAIRSFGVATAVGGPGCPRFPVTELRFPGTVMRWGPVPIPPGTKADPSADGHLAIWDPGTRREWDLWQAACKSGAWSCGAGAAVSTDGLGAAPSGTASGNAANLPLLGGLLRPEDLAEGRIRHALVFAQPGVNRPLGPLHPATHNDGSASDSRALQEGSLLQLAPDLDVETLPLPAWQRVVAKALQTYGMYLRDEGGTLTLYAENPVNRAHDGFAELGLTGPSAFFDAAFPWNRMRVVAWRP